MSFQFRALADQIGKNHNLTSSDILALRQLGWESGHISLEEAETIFALNRLVIDPSPEWVDFFVEALCEFIVNGTPPRGYVDETEARWLIAALDQDGQLGAMAELELLVRVKERASNVPDSLKHYALSQIERSVMTGNGPTRCGGRLDDTHITAAECDLIRRLVFASGGHGSAGVNAHEAETLFRLKNVSLGHANAPEWPQLFVQAVGNYLTAYANHDAQISHARARELEAFMANNNSSIGSFLGRMASRAPSAFAAFFGAGKSTPSHAEQVATAKALDDQEQEWLSARMAANGRIDPLDQALLDFIAQTQAQTQA